MSTTESGGGVAGAGEAAELRQRLALLARKANEGDRQALADLRLFLDGHPEVEAHVGDLARLAEAAWVELLVGKDALTGEAVKRQLTQLKDGLAGSRPSAVEKLVVDLVAVNYLAERQAEIAAAAPDNKSLDQAAFRLKRAESTQRRYLNSLKMLSHLRALIPQGLVPEDGPRLFDPDRKIA
jgi:hypothetical protein